MKLYTKTGDLGETGLLGGIRVAKNHTRIEAIGAVDELNCCLGLLAARMADSPADKDTQLHLAIIRTQNQLFDIGAILARVPGGVADSSSAIQYSWIDSALQAVESEIDAFDSELPPLTEFILPGGNFAAAEAHFARAVCRRAERRVVKLARANSSKDVGDLDSATVDGFESVAQKSDSGSSGSQKSFDAKSKFGHAAQKELVALNSIVAFLNRIGDWLFVLARVLNQRTGTGDQKWRKVNEN